jgi:hypothetical protein
MKVETFFEQKEVKFERVEYSSGARAFIFPETGLSTDCLNPASWDVMTPMGNVRGVYSVDKLKDGSKPGIIIKFPERIFTREEQYLAKGKPWWGGPRTLERRVLITGNPLVESQSIWEGLILFQLNKLGFRAEIPVAIIETAKGTNMLVIKEIPVSCDGGRGEGSPKLEELQNHGFIPAGDWQGHNLLKDVEGKVWIIDVNRWQWRPHTDQFTKKLIDLVRATPG